MSVMLQTYRYSLYKRDSKITIKKYCIIIFFLYNIKHRVRQGALPTTKKANIMTISAQIVKSVLSGYGVTFAGMEYQTSIPTAAKFKTDILIEKRTIANVMLFQSIKDFEIYKKSVMRSINSIDGQESITDFEVSDNWFEHSDTDCFSIISSKKTGEKYLYFISNNAQSQYYINGELVEKTDIKQYLTPSKAKELFDNDGIVYNKKNDVMHTIHPRTLKLENIITLKANKQTIMA